MNDVALATNTGRKALPKGKKAPALVSVKANAFPVETLTKIPDSWLSGGRQRYGWGDLTKPKQFKRFPREQAVNARQSAAAWGKSHNVEFIFRGATDPETGEIIYDDVYYIKDASGNFTVETDKKTAIAAGEDNYKVRQEYHELLVIRTTPATPVNG